jgi:hypothetical protein
MPPKKKTTSKPPISDMDPNFAVEDNNLDDSRPSESHETSSSKKSGSGWRKVVQKFKGYTKKGQHQSHQTNTGTTAAKTSSQGEETKKDEEELNVQVVEDIDIRDQRDFNVGYRESEY